MSAMQNMSAHLCVDFAMMLVITMARARSDMMKCFKHASNLKQLECL